MAPQRRICSLVSRRRAPSRHRNSQRTHCTTPRPHYIVDPGHIVQTGSQWPRCDDVSVAHPQGHRIREDDALRESRWVQRRRLLRGRPHLEPMDPFGPLQERAWTGFLRLLQANPSVPWRPGWLESPSCKASGLGPAQRRNAPAATCMEPSQDQSDGLPGEMHPPEAFLSRDRYARDQYLDWRVQFPGLGGGEIEGHPSKKIRIRVTTWRLVLREETLRCINGAVRTAD